MRYNLSLAGVFGTITSVEETTWEWLGRNESVVVDGLERACAVTVDSIQRLVIGDRNVVGRDANELACTQKGTASVQGSSDCRQSERLALTVLLVLVVDSLEAVTDHSLTQKPEVRKFGKERTGIFDSSSVGNKGHEVGKHHKADCRDDQVTRGRERPCQRVPQLTNKVCLNHGDEERVLSIV